MSYNFHHSNNILKIQLKKKPTDYAAIYPNSWRDHWTNVHWERESNLRSLLNVLLKVMFSNSNGGPSRAQNSNDKGTGFIRPVKSSAGESSFWSWVTFSYVVSPTQLNKKGH